MKEISLLLNVVVLVFEVLYYALFMKFARKEGKFWRYLLLFSLMTFCLFFMKTTKIYTILVISLFILYGLKYIVKLKVSLYDMLVTSVMLLLKLFLEMTFSLLFYAFIKNIIIDSTITGIIKIFIILLMKNSINKVYQKFERLWKNNNFYIRYIFTIIVFSYIICTCLFYIIKWI